jgi:hypothetical protein
MQRQEHLSLALTEAAKEEFRRLQMRLMAELDEAIKRETYVPGDRVIEVTAADMRELARNVRLQHNYREQRRASMRLLIVSIYGTIGVLMILAGIFFDEIRFAIGNPTRAMLLGIGSALLLASVVFYAWYRTIGNMVRSQRNKKRFEPRFSDKAESNDRCEKDE